MPALCISPPLHLRHCCSVIMMTSVVIPNIQAICFALLAYQTCRGRPTNVPSKY